MKTTALFFTFVLSILFLFGCGSITSESSMNHIGIGMTKEEVISVLGSPKTTGSPGGGVEVMNFDLWSSEYDWVQKTYWEEYFVRFENGKVASYGRMGDFDSTKDPTINVNIKQE